MIDRSFVDCVLDGIRNKDKVDRICIAASNFTLFAFGMFNAFSYASLIKNDTAESLTDKSALNLCFAASSIGFAGYCVYQKWSKEDARNNQERLRIDRRRQVGVMDFL